MNVYTQHMYAYIGFAIAAYACMHACHAMPCMGMCMAREREIWTVGIDDIYTYITCAVYWYVETMHCTWVMPMRESCVHFNVNTTERWMLDWYMQRDQIFFHVTQDEWKIHTDPSNWLRGRGIVEPSKMQRRPQWNYIEQLKEVCNDFHVSRVLTVASVYLCVQMYKTHLSKLREKWKTFYFWILFRSENFPKTTKKQQKIQKFFSRRFWMCIWFTCLQMQVIARSMADRWSC